MPGSSRHSEDEGRKAFEAGGGERRKAERRPMWIEHIMPKKQKSKVRGRGGRRPFQLNQDD